jgi:hypothetical protein
VDNVLARPAQGTNDWAQADTAREAIRRAMLLAPCKPPPWLLEAAADAERMIDDQAVPNHDLGDGSPGDSSSGESARN